jgi:hypothetical protein
MNVRWSLGVSLPIRKYEVEFSLGAFVSPSPQRVHHERGEGDVTLAGLGLWRANAAPSVRALAHMDHTGIKIDIGPRPSLWLAQSQCQGCGR